MKRTSLLALCSLLLILAACDAPPAEPLVIYSGRSKALVDSLVQRFQAQTGIPVEVRYGDTAQLAVALTEEGAQSQADLFWAQDAGALGAVHGAGLLAPLPDSLLGKLPAAYRNADGTWVATSGRARSLAYAPARIAEADLPQHIADLTDPKYKGRIGWAPTNGSFQAWLTAYRLTVGDDAARAWLEGMKANEAKAYPRNSAIVQGIADGEVDLGLPNHYYLYRFTSQDPNFPVAQTYFAQGDPGNLINVAGLGVLASSDQVASAHRFISFALSPVAQQYFADETFEYPVTGGITPQQSLVAMDRLSSLQPTLNLDDLRDLEATLNLLREVGLL